MSYFVKETQPEHVRDLPLCGFRIELRFNRDIDKEKDYISPGGYEITNRNTGKVVNFDFVTYYGNIHPSEKDRVVFECEEYDEEVASGKIITGADILDSDFTEFYIYTDCGSTDDNAEYDLSPVELISLKLVFAQEGGRLICNLPGKQIEAINALFLEQDV